LSRLLSLLFGLGSRRASWAAIVAICVALDAAAVWFQVNRLQFPCELCIYTRVWIAAIALVGVAGFFLCRQLWPLRILLVAELGLVLGLAGVVRELLGLEYGFGGPGVCSMFPNFPAWAPLDQWWPTLFSVQGPCAATPKVLFGLSMADGLAGVTVGFVVALGFALAGSFRPAAAR